ncbi:MAG: HEAT repeat domain-containing protein [Pirellulaceae bacterium]
MSSSPPSQEFHRRRFVTTHSLGLQASLIAAGIAAGVLAAVGLTAVLLLAAPEEPAEPASSFSANQHELLRDRAQAEGGALRNPSDLKVAASETALELGSLELSSAYDGSESEWEEVGCVQRRRATDAPDSPSPEALTEVQQLAQEITGAPVATDHDEEGVVEPHYWSAALDEEPDPWASDRAAAEESADAELLSELEVELVGTAVDEDAAEAFEETPVSAAEAGDLSALDATSPLPTSPLPASPKPTSPEDVRKPAALAPRHAPRHLPRLDAEQLVAHLSANVPRLRFDTKSESAKSALLRMAANRGASRSLLSGELPPEQQLMQRLVAPRADLEGLAFRWGDGCRQDPESIKTLDQVSVEVRGIRGEPPAATSKSVADSRSRALLKLLEANAHWKSPRAVAALEQTLQVESTEVRAALIEHFASIDGGEATRAIARRALFDHDRTLRFAAVAALRERDPAEYEGVLLSGFDHPWDAVAWHAAEALALISDAHLVPELLAILDSPPPTAPRQDEQEDWRVREMVAVQHMQNCLLCHAPSTWPDDAVRGLIPDPNKPPPAVYYSRLPQGDFVRADVTYLKQDFSVMQEIESSGKLPKVQRVDYLVRRRKLTQDERAELEQQADERAASHRAAVVFLLGHLTGLTVDELRAIHRPTETASR